MSEITARMRAGQVAARKGADKDRTLLLGTVLASLKNRELELGRELDDAQVIDVLRKQIKQRQDSVEQYRTGKRDDLAAREEFEIGVLRGYLPADVDSAEIRATAAELVAGGATDLGKVMAGLMARYRGKADGKLINEIAREALPRQ